METIATSSSDTQIEPAHAGLSLLASITTGNDFELITEAAISGCISEVQRRLLQSAVSVFQNGTARQLRLLEAKLADAGRLPASIQKYLDGIRSHRTQPNNVPLTVRRESVGSVHGTPAEDRKSVNHVEPSPNVEDSEASPRQNVSKGYKRKARIFTADEIQRLAKDYSERAEWVSRRYSFKMALEAKSISLDQYNRLVNKLSSAVLHESDMKAVREWARLREAHVVCGRLHVRRTVMELEVAGLIRSQTGDQKALPLVPLLYNEQERLDALRRLHDRTHCGTADLIKEFHQHFVHFTNIDEEAEWTVDHCSECRSRVGQSAMQIAISPPSRAVYAVDILSGLPGVKPCILIVLDTATSFLMFDAMTDQHCGTLTAHLKRICDMFGDPQQISYYGPESFIADLKSSLPSGVLYDINGTRDSSIVCLREIKRYLAALVTHYKDIWLKYLPGAVDCLNCERRGASVLTPYEALFFIEPDPDGEIRRKARSFQPLWAAGTPVYAEAEGDVLMNECESNESAIPQQAEASPETPSIERPRSERRRVPVGIVNGANRCFGIALLQALFLTKSVSKIVSSLAHATGQGDDVSSTVGTKLLHEMDRVFLELAAARRPVDAKDLFRALPRTFCGAKSVAQGDPMELFLYIINTISGQAAAHGQPANLACLFTATMMFQVRCLECFRDGPKSSQQLITLDLALVMGHHALYNQKFVGLSHLLEAARSATLLQNGEEYYCVSCQTKRVGVQRNWLTSLPSVLVLHLKRWHRNGAKDETPVTFPSVLPMDTILPNGQKKAVTYVLYNVMCHIGPHTSEGHWICIARHSDTSVQAWQEFQGKSSSMPQDPAAVENHCAASMPWYKFDDAVVTVFRAKQFQLLQQTGTLPSVKNFVVSVLFYARVDA